ncbi:MAG: T9SS type A sorting domain-containing protein [Lishizhenia sp.]
MKRIFYTLISLGICYFAQAQIVQSNCNAPLDVVNSYCNDADFLTLERIRTNNYTYLDSLDIPTPYSDTILNALIAVFNATSIPERDTVVDFLNIHTFKSYSLNTVSFTADSSLSWMQNLHAGNVPFGEPVLDNYYNTLGLSLIGYINIPINISANARIQFNQNLNVFHIANEISNIASVSIAEPSYFGGDGSSILDTITPSYIELTYRYAWGDCFSGCTASRSYKFRVYYDCSVEFVESYGQPLPAYANISNEAFTDIKVYPNPSANTLKVVNVKPGTMIEISNLNGLAVKKGELENNQIQIIDLQPGVYYLSFYQNGQMVVKRFIKI